MIQNTGLKTSMKIILSGSEIDPPNFLILCSPSGSRAGVNVTIFGVIINTQDMLAAGVFAFPSLAGR